MKVWASNFEVQKFVLLAAEYLMISSFFVVILNTVFGFYISWHDENRHFPISKLEHQIEADFEKWFRKILMDAKSFLAVIILLLLSWIHVLFFHINLVCIKSGLFLNIISSTTNLLGRQMWTVRWGILGPETVFSRTLKLRFELESYVK